MIKVFAAVFLLGSWLNLSAREPMGPLPLWNLAKLDAVPEVEWGATEGLVQEVYYRGEPFQGKATRVFAYVGRPEGEGPFPGVVLVHGGGGQAFKEWADHWAKRGYVSIAMDTAGNGPGKVRLEDGGPDQADDVKFRDFSAEGIRDMWTYHAVADVILAHSLLRSLPEVDKEKTALTGISWGGYLTCIVAGIDGRFKAAVPVYGCGFLHDNSAWEEDGIFSRMPEEARRMWIRNFDPGQHLAQTACPILFFNGTNDFAYPLDSYRKSIEQVKPELVTVSIEHQLSHGHIWTFEIVDRFIDSVLTGGEKLARLGELRVAGDVASAEILNGMPVASAELWHTVDEAALQKRKWKTTAGTVADGRITAKVPDERPVTFYLQAVDAKGIRTSTAHFELLAKGDAANAAVIPAPKLEQDFYDWHKRHAEILRIKHEVDPEVVLIGDSITHMWGGLPEEPGRANGAGSWNALFGDKALNLGFGWDRTQNVLWRIDHGELDGLKPKLVVIHIGTNNLAGTKNYEAGTPVQIAEGIRAIGVRVRDTLPEAKIVLMAVFPRGENPDHPMRKPIAEINALLPEIAKGFGAEFVDIGAKLLDDAGVYPKVMAGDFLHPSAQGYEVWAEALRPFVGE
jgi:dienelactone hydrolase/lysophospholipase L1-like esterase